MSCNKKDDFLKYNYSKLSDRQKAEKVIQIAGKKWDEVYGEKTMADEKPLIAKRINDSLWYVEGNYKKIEIGGVAFGKVDVKNKKVIEYSHGE